MASATDYQQLVIEEIKRGSLTHASHPHPFTFSHLAEGNTTHGMTWCNNCHESKTYIMHNLDGFRA